MYTLTTSALGKVLRSVTQVRASEALKTWFADETTGYDVVCKDKKGASVSRAQLREAMRNA